MLQRLRLRGRGVILLGMLPLLAPAEEIIQCDPAPEHRACPDCAFRALPTGRNRQGTLLFGWFLMDSGVGERMDLTRPDDLMLLPVKHSENLFCWEFVTLASHWTGSGGGPGFHSEATESPGAPPVKYCWRVSFPAVSAGIDTRPAVWDGLLVIR